MYILYVYMCTHIHSHSHIHSNTRTRNTGQICSLSSDSYPILCVCFEYGHAWLHVCVCAPAIYLYGVALVGRIDKIIGLFCKRPLLKRPYSAKKTCNLIDPTHRSQPITCQKQYEFAHTHKHDSSQTKTPVYPPTCPPTRTCACALSPLCARALSDFSNAHSLSVYLSLSRSHACTLSPFLYLSPTLSPTLTLFFSHSFFLTHTHPPTHPPSHTHT